jgi:hypothetical protein
MGIKTLGLTEAHLFDFSTMIEFQGDLTFELREYPSVKWVCTEATYDMSAEVGYSKSRLCF